MTIEAQIIEAMREAKKPVDLAYLRERLGMERQEVSDSLRRLFNKGWINKKGNSRRMFYTVKRYGTPKDGRGLSPGSRTGRNHANPHAAGIKSAIKRGQHPRPIARTALEQAWGWAPSYPQLREPATCGLLIGGNVRLQES